MNKKKIIVGARGSKLAIKYAERAIRQIKKFYNGKIELKKIITKGDKVLNRRTSEIGDHIDHILLFYWDHSTLRRLLRQF